MAAMNWIQCHGLVSAAKVKAKSQRPQRRLFPLAWLIAGVFTFSAHSEEMPSCLPPVFGAALVKDAKEQGLLFLRDGRTAKLEGLVWPPHDRDNPSNSLLARLTAALQDLVAGQRVLLHVRQPKLDRYNRLRVQALLGDGRWLQREVLRRGLARASIAPDRPECARELYAAEAEARAANVGLWTLPEYRIRSPEALRWRDLGSFQIVEGRVVNAKVSGGRAYLNFGQNWRTDFTVTIAPPDMKRFKAANVDPYGYAGKRIRIRGWIDRLHGFEIEAASPEAIEVLK
jgi:micrococcal nuclease